MSDPLARFRRFGPLLFALVLGAAAGADKPKFTSTWKPPDAMPASFAGKKVAALVISRDDNLRFHSEEQLAAGLSARGMTAVASYRIVPREELENAERARGWYERAGVQGVVVLRPVNVEQRRTYAPVEWNQPSYATLWGYYGYGWVGVYDPGGVRDDTILVVETLVYSVPEDRLLWGGVSETTNPKSAATFIADLIKEAVKEMKKQGLIPR